MARCGEPGRAGAEPAGTGRARGAALSVPLIPAGLGSASRRMWASGALPPSDGVNPMSSLKLTRWRTLRRWREASRSRKPCRWPELRRSRSLSRYPRAVAGLALVVTGCASSGAGQAGHAGHTEQAGVPGPADAASQEALRPPPLPLGAALPDTTWLELPRELSGRLETGWRLAFGGPRSTPGVYVIVNGGCPVDQPFVFFEGKVFPCFSPLPALEALGPGMRVRMRIVRGRPAATMFGSRAQRGGVLMFVIWDPDGER
jgi:hypothetical protein